MVLYESRVDLYKVDYELTCIYWFSLGQFTISSDSSLVIFDEDASWQMWYCYLPINHTVVSSYTIWHNVIITSLYIFSVITPTTNITN